MRSEHLPWHIAPKDLLNRRLNWAFDNALDPTLGYRLNRAESRLIVEFRPDFHAVYHQFPDYRLLLDSWNVGNRMRHCGHLARFCTLYLNLKQVLSEGVTGDFVELGAYRGNSAGILAYFAKKYGRRLGATRAVDEFFRDLPEKPILAADKSGTAIIRRAATVPR